jgi:hypothetical protein
MRSEPGIILDYSGGSSVINKLLTSGSRRQRKEKMRHEKDS